MSPAIVIVTYNRPESLIRILESIENAFYEIDSIPLIISIDHQDSSLHQDVIQIAESFHWAYGDKKVIQHSSNIGLRNHVLYCGSLTEKYKAIILLEDDVVLSKYYYSYARQALGFYEYDENIAGISLYNHLINVNCNRPFYPDCGDGDIYLLQFAQSWGQCWTESMWGGFYNWYTNNLEFESNANFPAFVYNWPQTSWLKYFVKYLVEFNKFFVYPSISLSTNFNDAGTHIKVKNTLFQVPLETGNKKYRFLDSENQATKYDVFFERINLDLGLPNNDVCIDIYGLKPITPNQRYLLTSKEYPFYLLRSFGLYMRPHELNITFKVKGRNIFLYDTSKVIDHPKKVKKDKNIELLYDNRVLGINRVKRLLLTMIANKIFKR
ncbi:hypothetical protein OQZ33_02670 [Pedobacter sp. MC2016-05]|uniref:hypothetical protein n=1 Tax=Pedobacter sp. MC2016-05 TaxID=2994474 RepID=UPI002246E171|nr:hypothetical protein [Pedobacter sp. MC2016-05]MCX2473228.1 hypothetical protein [Pedobacter sp. MC2016-05]